MKGVLEVPGFHSADKVGIYWKQQPVKFNWDYITPKINKGCGPEMFCFSGCDVTGWWPQTPPKTFSLMISWESYSCLVTLSKLIRSRPEPKCSKFCAAVILRHLISHRTRRSRSGFSAHSTNLHLIHPLCQLSEPKYKVSLLQSGI